jgi:hypothetical protein
MPIARVLTEISPREQEAQDKAFWKSQSPAARLAALNFLVRHYYGLLDESPTRFSRLPAITERPMR